MMIFFFFQAEDGIRDLTVTGVQTCALPISCDVSAISPERRKRKNELDKILRSSQKGVRELPDGFEFEFPSDASTFQDVAEWAGMERLCCQIGRASCRERV